MRTKEKVAAYTVLAGALTGVAPTSDGSAAGTAIVVAGVVILALLVRQVRADRPREGHGETAQGEDDGA